MALEENNSLQAEEAPISLRKSQMSYNGIAVIAGQIVEDCNEDLRWPQCMETYKLMAKDATVAPALNLMEMAIAKAEWSVRIPEGYEEELKDKAEFLRSCMDDMEHTWNDFIRSASTFNRYGFAALEKVYYKRTKENGSKHNDGLYGIKKLPLISQDSIKSWYWSKDGRTLRGLKQWVNIPTGEDEIQSYRVDKIDIPRKKFILFRADPQKDSPIGTSPLNSVYIAWRFKTELERQESVSIANDLRGLKVFKIPPRYMSESANEEEKETYEVFKQMLRGMHSGEQSGVIIPSAYDDQGKPLFDFNVISVMGQASNNLDQIILRYKNDIVTGILNPHLVIGQSGGGSFALAESLEGISKTVIDARLKELRDQINHDLIPQLFAINGFSVDVLPQIDYTQPDNVGLDELSKFIQRCASVGMLKQDAATLNWIAEQAGMPIPFDDEETPIEDVRTQVTGYSSGAGEGGATPGEGTAKSVLGRDTTISNLENT